MNYKIEHLSKEKWKDTVIPIKYTTDKYYDVSIDKNTEGFSINIKKSNFEKAVSHYPEEYDFPDRLYADYWEHAYAWGVIDNGKLVAAIETDPELWSNRLRVTELWVDDAYHGQGIGKALMNMAKEQLRRDRYRAIILETQSCNTNAIGFYMHEGFTLMGFDACCYSNDDLNKKEVRLEMGWFPEKKQRLTIDDIEIRQETEKDCYDVELVAQRAFWNKHHLGCDEHYLVHNLRQSEDYIPELSRIAVYRGRVIGCIMYSKAKIVNESNTYDIITFGPLCVDPDYQGTGVGGILLEETLNIARQNGYKAVVIYGEPDYYPLHGFKTCDNFNITTPDGKNFDAFMCYELTKGAFDGICGKFYESDVYDIHNDAEVEEYSKKFPTLPKLRFPGQWD